MRRLLFCVGLAAVLGLTACGGGGNDKKAAATTVPTVALLPTTTLLTGNDQAGTPFCKLARTYTEKFSSLLSVANDKVKLKAATTDAESAISQAKSQAPPELKADVNAVAATASQVLAALQKVDFVFQNLPTSELAKLQDPGFQKSVDKITAYGTAHCGISG